MTMSLSLPGDSNMCVPACAPCLSGTWAPDLSIICRRAGASTTTSGFWAAASTIGHSRATSATISSICGKTMVQLTVRTALTRANCTEGRQSRILTRTTRACHCSCISRFTICMLHMSAQPATQTAAFLSHREERRRAWSLASASPPATSPMRSREKGCGTTRFLYGLQTTAALNSKPLTTTHCGQLRSN